MDIARPSNAKKKRIKQAIYAGVGLLAVVLVSVGLSRLKPAAPTVERAVVWPAKLKLGAAEAGLANIRVQLNNDLLAQRATSATVEADYNKAKMQAQMNEALAKDQLVSDLVLKQSQVDATSLEMRNQISK